MLIEIDPTVDFACKLLLGNPEFPDITIHFLNAILRLPAPIVSVEIINPIVWKEFEADKLSILDILAIDNADRRLNVEVQRTKPTCLPQRLTYYSATQLVDQIGEGDSYRKLRPSQQAGARLDDRLSLEEYQAGLKGEDNLEARFKNFDQNSDGKLTREEFVGTADK